MANPMILRWPRLESHSGWSGLGWEGHVPDAPHQNLAVSQRLTLSTSLPPASLTTSPLKKCV